jgi:hypothetical protein
MSAIITVEMKDQIEAAGWEAIVKECTVPEGTYAYGEVEADLRVFLDILDEAETFQDVQQELGRENLQYCGFHAAHDKFMSFMEKHCPVHKAEREYYSL